MYLRVSDKISVGYPVQKKDKRCSLEKKTVFGAFLKISEGNDKRGKMIKAALYGLEGEALSFLSCLYSYGQKTNVAYLNDLGRTWPGVKIVKGGAFKNPNLYSPFKKYACLPFLPEVISRPEIEKCPWGTYGVEVVFDFAGKDLMGGVTARAKCHLAQGARSVISGLTPMAEYFYHDTAQGRKLFAVFKKVSKNEEKAFFQKIIMENMKQGVDCTEFQFSDGTVASFFPVEGKRGLFKVLHFKESPFGKNRYEEEGRSFVFLGETAATKILSFPVENNRFNSR